MTKKGDRYECGECGVVMVVEDPCGCGSCDLICCGWNCIFSSKNILMYRD